MPRNSIHLYDALAYRVRLRNEVDLQQGRLRQKEKARAFLQELEDQLERQLPPPSKMRLEIQQTVEAALARSNKCLHGPEYAFLNAHVVPAIFSHLQSIPGIGEEQARKAFLSEWYNGEMRRYHSNTPARSISHPFGKAARAGAHEVMRRWRGEQPNTSGGFRKPLHQPCPDLSIGEPFPYPTVFEIKYFSGGDGVTALVDGIYEAFYYRAMPFVPAQRNRPAWMYEYGCFLAFDASSEGSLSTAWNSLDLSVRSGFWDGGNLFVMILRPKESLDA